MNNNSKEYVSCFKSESSYPSVYFFKKFVSNFIEEFFRFINPNLIENYGRP